MRTFIYCRVSTREQDTQNQVLAIERAGYKVPESRVISEDISGSVQAMQRPKFRAMVEHKLEAGQAGARQHRRATDHRHAVRTWREVGVS